MGRAMVSNSEHGVVVSVIIAAYNAEETLGDQLAALERESLDDPWEVILADNGSTDRTVAVFDRYASRFQTSWKVEDASAMSGQAYARNVGAEVARGEYLVFVDADDVVAPGYLAAMKKALEVDCFVAARLEIDRLNPSWAKPRHPPPQLREIPLYLGFLPAAGGGTLGIRRQTFEALGGFDVSVPGLEDAEFCWRAKLAGTDLAFASDAVLSCRYRGSLPAFYLRGLRDGIARTALYARFREHGMPHRSARSAMRFHAGVLRQVLSARTRSDLSELFETFGVRVGLIRGCVRHRVWYL